MKHSKLHLKLIVFSFICLFSKVTFAQSDYEKRQKANKENEEHLKRVYENNLPNKTTSGISSTVPKTSPSSTSSIYVTDHQRKMDYYNNKENARLAAWEEKEQKFKILSADVPKTEANYRKLISLAEQAGFDYYDAMRINGRYAPKVVSLPTLVPYKQEQFDNYKKLAEDSREKGDWVGAAYAFNEAIKLSEDPLLREQLAYLYQDYLYDYNNASKQYLLIEQSTITHKPDMKYIYQKWGQASIMTGNYENAIECFSGFPARNYDGNLSILHSYAYFLAGNMSKAKNALLNSYSYDHYNNLSNLIKNYYLIKDGSHEGAAKLLSKNKEQQGNIAYTGTLSTDLSLIFFNVAQFSRFDRDLDICYLLDLAADLDPSNMDIAGLRYDYNIKMKRIGFDSQMSSELRAKLIEGASERALLKEKMFDNGYMILWFGNGDKAKSFVAWKVRMLAGIDKKKVTDNLLEKTKNKSTDGKYPYINYTFLRNAKTDEAYNEIAKMLKINLEKAKESKYGALFPSDTYEFY